MGNVGYCARNGLEEMISNQNGRIIAVSTQSKSSGWPKSSSAMEPENLKNCLRILQENNITVSVLTTDFDGKLKKILDCYNKETTNGHIRHEGDFGHGKGLKKYFLKHNAFRKSVRWTKSHPHDMESYISVAEYSNVLLKSGRKSKTKL